MKGAPFLPTLLQSLYKSAVRPFLFKLNAETAHDWAVKRLQQLEAVPLAMDLVQKRLSVSDERLRVTIKTLQCPNPVGLAAGFDKTGELIRVMPAFGFGFIESGTFTPLVQEGQKKPRLFRFKKEKALINRMGFNNPGVKAGAHIIREKRKQGVAVPVGVNIGKGRNTALEEAHLDYITAFEQVVDIADYVALNISSPNTPGLRDLQTDKYMRSLLGELTKTNIKLTEKEGRPPIPLFIKISPDVQNEALEEMAQLAVEFGLGLIATNTTIDHSILKTNRKEDGGLSGRPLKTKSNAILKRLYQLTRGAVPLIGVGGIFSAEDAYEKVCLGASLIQIYTGWIYEGPDFVQKINRGLLRLLERDGHRSIKEAVGSAH